MKKSKKNNVIKWFTIILIIVFLIVTFGSWFVMLFWNSWNNRKTNSVSSSSVNNISTDGISN